MYKADFRDKPIVVELLTQAFDDNKSVNFVVCQDADRKKRIARLMRYSYDVCHAFGEIWISDDRNACALLLFPDQKRTSLQSLSWDLKLLSTVIGIHRLPAVLKRERLIKANYPKDNRFAYLWFFAVHADHQGGGFGTQLLTEVLNECTKTKRNIYLETSMERNLPFYKRLGFEVYETLQLTYTLYQLRRVIE